MYMFAFCQLFYGSPPSFADTSWRLHPTPRNSARTTDSDAYTYVGRDNDRYFLGR